MKKLLPNLKVTAVLFMLIFSSIKMSAQQNYMKQNQEMATQLSAKYGIPSSIILAVAFVESGGGTSKNSKLFHNHFGITGKNTVTNSRFKSYGSVQESYEAFCQLLARKNYYSKLKGSMNLENWISSIAKAGYAEDPHEWTSKILYVVRKYNLK